MWKDVLLPGTVALTKGEARFDAQDIRNAAEVCNAKLAYGWRIPLCWEHHDEALPVRLSAGERMVDRLASLAKNVCGEVRSFREHDGRLQFLPDVYDEADRPRLNKAKFVSPQVRRNWKDSDGNVWEGLTVQHVAATPIPKQRLQDTFQLSAAGDGPIRIPEEEIIRLSEGSAVKIPKLKKALLADVLAALKNLPATKRFNLSDADDEEAGDGEGDADVAGSTPPEMADLIAALQEKGMNIPEEVKNLSDLIIAVKASGPCDTPSDTDQDYDADGAGPVREATAQPPMSLSNATAVAAMAPALKKSLERADAMTRKDLTARIEKLVQTGRITPVVARPMADQVGAINLSFRDDGDVIPNGLIAKIEAYEALPVNSQWAKKGRKVNLSGAEPAEPLHPLGHKLDDSPAAQRKRMEDFDATVARH